MNLLPLTSYIDPSAVSVLVTSIAGVAVAVSTTFVILFRKAKKKVANVLHIDENANKQVEEDLVVNDDAELQTQTTDNSDGKTE